VKLIKSIALFSLLAAVLGAQTTPSPQVRFKTNIGDIDVTLFPDSAPLTVANFLNYVNKGAYTSSIIHRSVPGFIIQGGGFQLVGGSPAPIASDAAVTNEYKISNTRGTIAMAKLDGNPNSATNQWFFNLVDNASNLDNANGGFTVFGKISNPNGLTTMDAIAKLPIQNLGAPLDTVPYSGTSYVTVNTISYIPQATAAAVQDAASFAPANLGVTAGQLIVIYGQSLGPADLTTLTLDSQGKVSTFLAGTRVLINGTAAPVIYASVGQVSVVVPQNVAGRNSANVVMEYQGIQSAGFPLPVVASNPAIFTLNSSGKGDGAIQRFPAYDVISGTNPARAGDVLIVYGEGYGDTEFGTSVPDGTIVGSTLPRPLLPVRLLIDGAEVPTSYKGGAPGIVSGVLQINFALPNIAPGSHEIQIQVGDKTSPAGVKLQTQ
jgi:uncharacterized protein (TIGR03437 family)